MNINKCYIVLFYFIFFACGGNIEKKYQCNYNEVYLDENEHVFSGVVPNFSIINDSICLIVSMEEKDYLLFYNFLTGKLIKKIDFSDVDGFGILKRYILKYNLESPSYSLRDTILGEKLPIPEYKIFNFYNDNGELYIGFTPSFISIIGNRATYNAMPFILRVDENFNIDFEHPLFLYKKFLQLLEGIRPNYYYGFAIDDKTIYLNHDSSLKDSNVPCIISGFISGDSVIGMKYTSVMYPDSNEIKQNGWFISSYSSFSNKLFCSNQKEIYLLPSGKLYAKVPLLNRKIDLIKQFKIIDDSLLVAHILHPDTSENYSHYNNYIEIINTHTLSIKSRYMIGKNAGLCTFYKNKILFIAEKNEKYFFNLKCLEY